MADVHKTRQWDGRSAEELVAEDICPQCFGELDTGWECNECNYDASHLVRAAKGKELDQKGESQ